MTEEPEDLNPTSADEPVDPAAPEEGGAGEPVQEQPEEPDGDDTNWRTIGIIAIVGLVVVIILLLLFSALGPGSGGETTPTPEAIEARIEISEPTNGATLDITNPVTVSGVGAALPEGNVVVQALDTNNNVLAETATIVDSPDAGTGGEGPWSVQLDIKTEPGTAGTIRAFSPSPADGSIIAEDTVEVSYGQTEAVDSFIRIEQPQNGATVDISGLVTVNGTGGGLPEGNVVVQAVDDSNNVLAEATTTIQSPDAGTGGQGPWSVDLQIQTEPGTPGRINAFSLSPADGSNVASASVEVTFGATPEVDAFIEIQEPADGSVVDIAGPVTVSGVGGGLFEGNVVIQATSSDGSVLAESATIVQTGEVGGSGPWSTTLDIQTDPGSTGQIIAFSPSPVDGSNMASDQINVTYGTAPEPTEPPPTPETGITDHHWELISNGGTAVIEDTQIGADFGTDGTVSGSAGCNDYSGPYQLDGNSLTVGPLNSTQMACNEPPGIMEQESTYLNLLQTAASYEITQNGGQLIVRDGSGSEILVYNAAVTGEVTYLPGIALPDDAVITVQLQDTSLADAPAVVLGEQVIQTNGRQVPIPYVVFYNANDIQPNHTYTMQARITDGAGNLLFINDTAIPVITNGNPTHDVEIMTVPVS